jgi:uncharacterized coiled-coil DUF342 family protein
MTQVEFENQLRELNGQKAQVMNMYALMQNEVKEEIAEKNRQIHELSEQVQRLKVQRAGLTERRLKAEREWGDKIRKFTSENFSETRALADVSEWSLAAELRHRGYTGQLINPEKGEEFMMNLNGKLNGCINGKADGKED